MADVDARSALHLLLIVLLSSLLPFAVSKSCSPPTAGLRFTQLTDTGGYPPRQNAHIARLTSPQTYFDLDSGANVTVPANSFLLYGGEFDCVPDVWLSPPSDRTRWSLISGLTSFNDCEGPWTASAYPHAAYTSTQGRMHTASLSNGRTLLLGGWSPKLANQMLNEVWYSDDRDNHIRWTLADTHPTRSFSPRALGGAIAIDDPTTTHSTTLYVIGGLSPNGLLNDVWASLDLGLTWSLTSAAAPFAPRQDAMVTGYWSRGASAARLFVIGGIALNASSPSQAGVARDVWTSTTGGRTWTALPDAPFSPRARSGVVATPGGVLMVVAGATTHSHGTWDSWVVLGEVWASFDGAVSWVNCTAEGGFGGRELPSVVVDEAGYLQVMNGLAGWPSFGSSDVWKSDISVWDNKALMQACGVQGEAKEEEEMEEVKGRKMRKKIENCSRCRAQTQTE